MWPQTFSGEQLIRRHAAALLIAASSRPLFCVGNYRQFLLRIIGAGKWHPGWGPGSDRELPPSFKLSAQRISNLLTSALPAQKNMERRHRLFFQFGYPTSVYGAACIGACWAVRLAYLKGQHRQAAMDIAFVQAVVIFIGIRSNRPRGRRGQSQAHAGWGYFQPCLPVERHYWRLAFERAANTSAAFRLYHHAWRAVCRTPPGL